MMYAYNVYFNLKLLRWGDGHALLTFSCFQFNPSLSSYLCINAAPAALLACSDYECLYFHTSLSVQLNLTSVRMWIQKGNTAAKNNLQVEFRALLSLSLSVCHLRLTEQQILPSIHEYLWRSFYLKPIPS